ncbi:thioredoxin [Halococcoides cellulosivorans]|uniref:Thioredoxin n=1 Tax=Halococcoides cellulosivorans TaxID=1679096 RepID=A0A2R4WZN1_9EURY|nr:thioredoxin [Halococcoides cellulosivorans]AWB27006.1 thioredoxin [Halococcoides cellulosivorans]
MTLDSMTPDGEPSADAVATLSEIDDSVAIRVWGGDWCPDCRDRLPAFAAALAAAGIDDQRVHVYPVEKRDGEKVGPRVERDEIVSIPTVVVESGADPTDRDGSGTERARYVEDEGEPIATWLADRLAE